MHQTLFFRALGTCSHQYNSTQVIIAATAMDTSTVMGNSLRECAMERVMTPVMVPGLAANKAILHTNSLNTASSSLFIAICAFIFSS